MKKLILLVPVILGLVFVLSCGKNGDSKNDNCQKDAQTINLDFTTPWLNPHFNAQTEGNSRVYQVYTDVFENVCPDEHIKVKILCQITNAIGIDRDIQLRVEYRYGYFGVFGNTWNVPFYANGVKEYNYEGETTFGIKNAYEDEPGSFYLNIEWVMDTTSDEEMDLNWFKQLTISCWVDVTLKYYKN